MEIENYLDGPNRISNGNKKLVFMRYIWVQKTEEKQKLEQQDGAPQSLISEKYVIVTRTPDSTLV